jgi:Flp pilus assembly protein TadG
MTQPPKKSRFTRNDRGQSLVEFALTLPMLLVVMLMITEFGRALFQYNVLVQATRAGARSAVVASQGGAPGVGETHMDNFLDQTGMNLVGLDRKVQVVSDFKGTGTTVVQATADLPFRWLLQGDMPTSPGGANPVTPLAFTLHAETVMRAETF